MNLPVVCIVTNAQKTNLNLVFEAMGMGPETFTRKCCAIDPNATDQTPPTHWLMSYVAATDSDVAIYQTMTAGNLPPLPQGVVWGVNGIISAADAMAASDGSVFHVYSAAGQIEPVDHCAAVLQSEGLQYVPDPPL
jgi:hypothetical protein